MSKYKSIPVYVNGGKIAGIIRGKTFDIRKHKSLLLETPPAIGLNVEALNTAEQMGAEDVKVTVIETGRIYQQTIPNIKKFSQIQRRGEYEPQRIVCLEYWRVVEEGEVFTFDRDAPLPPLKQSEPTIKQLGMFGGVK
jgi:hypothetical protein